MNEQDELEWMEHLESKHAAREHDCVIADQFLYRIVDQFKTRIFAEFVVDELARGAETRKVYFVNNKFIEYVPPGIDKKREAV